MPRATPHHDQIPTVPELLDQLDASLAEVQAKCWKLYTTAKRSDLTIRATDIAEHAYGLRVLIANELQRTPEK